MKSSSVSERLRCLVDAYCTDGLGEAELRELEAILSGDERARRFFAAYCRMHAGLLFAIRADQAVRLARGSATPRPVAAPALGPLGGAWQGTVSYFSQVGPLSYLLAVVITSLMLLAGWAYKINHYQQFAEAPAVPSRDGPELVFVGRITGMADCQWADPQTAAYLGASVPLERKYSLASGLMEITYDSGAKVILQGPCTYEVESASGGFLALGKLSARIESAKPQAANLQISKSPSLQTSNPQSLIPNPFVVRTPTAIVTDLGTEFGVEVSNNGDTTSHVFRGSVKVQVVVGGTGLASDTRRQEMVLRENESARVEKRDGKPLITRLAPADDTRVGVEMPPPKSVRDSEAYAELVLSLDPVVYYRMERPKGATAGSGATAGLPSSDDRNGRTLPDKPAVPPARVVFDSAPGGHHGDLRQGNEFGSPYVPGRFGDALWLRGPAVCDRVVVPNYPKATNDRLTVSVWVLATGRPGWAMIAANWGQSGEEDKWTGQFRIGLYQRDGDLHAYLTQRDGRLVRLREGASRQFPLFVWQHVALVADGTSLHLYRNGESVASGPAAGGILPQPPLVGLGVGCRLNNQTGTDAALDIPGYNFWQGRIDELAVFNQALSPEAIRRLYLGKSSPKREGNNVAGTLRVPPVISSTRLVPDQVPLESNTRHPDGTRSVPATRDGTRSVPTTRKGEHSMNGP